MITPRLYLLKFALPIQVRPMIPNWHKFSLQVDCGDQVDHSQVHGLIPAIVHILGDCHFASDGDKPSTSSILEEVYLFDFAGKGWYPRKGKCEVNT